MRVLVTGGGGFVGNAIVNRLGARGWKVASFSRGFYPDLESQNVEQIQGDLADREAVRKACQGRDAVVHVAARAGIWGRHRDFHQTNVEGTKNVIEACRSERIDRLVYTSSPSVVMDGADQNGIDEAAPYPDRYLASYPETKAQAERLILAAADRRLGTVSLRPHLIWGPGDRHLLPKILERARSGRLRQVGPGRNRVDFTYIDDVARAHLLALDRLRPGASISGKAYFISQDDPVSLWGFINRVLQAIGSSPVQRRISPTAAYALGTVCETVYRCFGIRHDPPMTRFLARSLATAHWFRIDAAKRELGYRPETSINEGLKHFANWWLQQGKGGKAQ
ncbi:MAG TPA: NAD-dependent epimerase/dehydratase family protein [Acidobacteriota bacterium]|nr:NAD-dependent epimerase/dehydratase family protein [Acidobacteriota bacterium]